MADLIQLIYSSTPFGYDSASLNGILVDARRCNEYDGVTGALVCRHDIFLQYLEGPAKDVAATYSRIARDDRHMNVTLHSKGPIDARLFGDWAMLHDPANSLIWDAAAVDGGALDTATPDQFIQVFTDIAAKSA